MWQLEVSIGEQLLTAIYAADAHHPLSRQYAIATAKKGHGQIEGSECTPLGRHRIAEKIGANLPENTVFVGRQATGEIYTEALAAEQGQRDWILTRILWLEGLEAGFNSGFLTEPVTVSEFTPDDAAQDNAALDTTPDIKCDTKQRYIYIHGCPDSHAMQIPSSHGCIKMRNADIIELFALLEENTPVVIKL